MDSKARENTYERVQGAAAVIREKTDERASSSLADIAIVLGSGLGTFVEELQHTVSVPYSKIPHFPVSAVFGHSGMLWRGNIGERTVFVMQGRVHHYEGWKLREVIFPIRVLAALGVKTLILTNAAGGVNKIYRPGNLVVIRDHINMIGRSPLRGPNVDAWGPRFPDMTEVYDGVLLKHAVACLTKLDGRPSGTLTGVYACMPGPQYETPAEVRMLRTLGADLVGMSTVPEAIAARHMGVKVVGISCVTNMAAGTVPKQLLDHAEVTETAKRVEAQFAQLLTAIVTGLPA